jgi:predicted MFS family arabinose efflux permease
VTRADVLERTQLARLQGVGLVSNVDRYVSAPLLVALTHRFHASLAAVTIVASGHLLAYGVSQLPWTAVLARHGPVLTMRLALAGAGLSAVAAAVAPGLGWLVVARVVGGALLGAAVPAALLYVGTVVAPLQRPQGFAAIVSANGLGIVVAVAIAVAATSTDLWWAAYLLTGAVLIACAWAAAGLPDGASADRDLTSHDAQAVATRAGGAVARVVRPVALVLVEGAVVVGAVVVLPALAQRSGQSVQVAAATVAVYGISMPLTGWALRQWPLPFTVATRMRWAVACLLLLPVAVIVLPPLVALATDAVLLGVAWSVLHPVLQAAATGAWAARTPVVLGLFVTALFAGSALGSQALALVSDTATVLVTASVCAAGGLLLLAVERLTARWAPPSDDQMTPKEGTSRGSAA